MSLTEIITKVLSECQSSLSCHQRLLKSLTAVYKKEEDSAVFFEAFFTPFSNVLVVFKREPAVERVIEFVAKFAVLTAPREEEGRLSVCVVRDEGREFLAYSPSI